MRKSGNCAYCRKEICKTVETKKILTDDTMNDIVHELSEHEELCEEIKINIRQHIMTCIYESNRMGQHIYDILEKIICNATRTYNPRYITLITAYNTLYLVSDHLEDDE